MEHVDILQDGIFDIFSLRRKIPLPTGFYSNSFSRWDISFPV